MLNKVIVLTYDTTNIIIKLHDVLAAFVVDVAVGNLDVGDGLICDETVGVAVVVWITVVVNVGIDVDALVVAVDCVFDNVTV
jgi:hypothetical protein